MLSKKEFQSWFETEVQPRWARHHFEWTEIGDWHWRLGGFDIDTLTQAVRRHKVCEDWRTPSLKKVYDYAGQIDAENRRRRGEVNRGCKQSTVPDTHTFIMCTAKDENGRGTVGWFVDILIWPFHKTYTAETYQRAAREQLALHARRGGVWEIFTNTNRGEMNKRSADLQGTRPLDLNQLRKR